MKQIFDWIPNEKILHLESHRFAILFWRSDCYPATGPKFCAILLTNYWAHITFPQIYNVMMYTLEVVVHFMQSIENDRSPYIILCSFNFGHCKLFFTSNIMHEKCIKVTILGCGWCQAISSKSKCQARVFPLGFKIFQTFGPVDLAAIYLITQSPIQSARALKRLQSMSGPPMYCMWGIVTTSHSNVLNVKTLNTLIYHTSSLFLINERKCNT